MLQESQPPVTVISSSRASSAPEEKGGACMRPGLIKHLGASSNALGVLSNFRGNLSNAVRESPGGPRQLGKCQYLMLTVDGRRLTVNRVVTSENQ